MTSFRRLTVKCLPRVMVKVLALDPRDHAFLLEDLREAAQGARPRPLCERVDFAARFDQLLDAQGDLFGTEGQNDPRGDRRD